MSPSAVPSQKPDSPHGSTRRQSSKGRLAHRARGRPSPSTGGVKTPVSERRCMFLTNMSLRSCRTPIGLMLLFALVGFVVLQQMLSFRNMFGTAPLNISSTADQPTRQQREKDRHEEYANMMNLAMKGRSEGTPPFPDHVRGANSRPTSCCYAAYHD